MYTKPLFKVKYYLSHISSFLLNTTDHTNNSKSLPSSSYLNHISSFLK